MAGVFCGGECVSFGVGDGCGGLEQGLRELESYAGAAEMLAGVRAVGLGGVDDGECLGDAESCRRGGGGR